MCARLFVVCCLLLALSSSSSALQSEPQPVDDAGLRQRFPDVFTLAASIRCGGRLNEFMDMAARMPEVEIRTSHSGLGGFSMTQGEAQFSVIWRDYEIAGPPLRESDRSRERELCPLRVLPPEYEGGTVYLDGVEIAAVTAPRTRFVLPPKTHDLRVSKEGLPDVVEQYSHPRARDVFVEVGTPARVFLRLDTPPDYRRLGEVHLDGERVGTLKHLDGLVEVTPGTHRVRISHPDLQDLEQEVDVGSEGLVQSLYMRPADP